MERRVETRPELKWLSSEDSNDANIPIDVLWDALGTLPERDKKWQPQIQMNMSDVGEWYSTILQVLELEEPVEHTETQLDPANYYATIREALLREDRLYDLIRQNRDASQVFPTLKPQARAEFEVVSKEISGPVPNDFGDDATYEIASNLLAKARDNLAEGYDPAKSDAIPLPMFGIPDPRAQRALVDSEEFKLLSDGLLSNWAVAVSMEDLPYFYTSTMSQRGVGVIMNSYLTGVQMRVSVEQILFDKKNLDDGVWVGEFELGRPRQEDEVDLRRAQVKMYVGCAYVNAFIAGKQRVKEGNHAIVARHDSLITTDKVPVHFFERYFDPESGEMGIVDRSFDESEKAEFAEWFLWFGYASQMLRPEIERRLKRRTPLV